MLCVQSAFCNVIRDALSSVALILVHICKHLTQEKRVVCLALTVFLLSCDFLCPVSFRCGAAGDQWSGIAEFLDIPT